MFNLYLVVTSIFALFSFLTLINLKLALKEPKTVDLHRYRKVVSQNQTQNNQNQQNNHPNSQPAFKKTLFYLLKNYTPLEIFIVRRARNKIPLLFSISVQSLINLVFQFSFLFSTVGIGVSLIFILIKLSAIQTCPIKQNNKEEQSKNNDKSADQGRKLQVLLTTLSLLINMGIIWNTFKNYNNQIFIKIAFNFALTFLIDNFIFKPVVLTILAFPLKFSDRVNEFINNETEIVEILHGERELCSSNNRNKNQKKVFVSTSQTENTLEIEPYVNLDPKQNILHPLDPNNSLQMHKIKPVNLKKKPLQAYDADSTLTGIVDPLSKRRQSFAIQKKSQQFNVHQLLKSIQESTLKENNSNLEGKRKAVHDNRSDLNEEYKNRQTNKSIRVTQSQFKENASYKECEFPKTPSKKNQQKNLAENSLKKHQDSLHLAHSYIKSYEKQPGTFDLQNHKYADNIFASGDKKLVKIYEDKVAEDFGEVEMKNPFRERNESEPKVIQEIEKKYMMKTPYKKYSLDRTKSILGESNVIQQFLISQKAENPKFQEKRRKSFHHYSEFSLTRKPDPSQLINESKLSKSFKRTRTKDPIVRQNDENRIPEFIIEDFQH